VLVNLLLPRRELLRVHALSPQLTLVLLAHVQDLGPLRAAKVLNLNLLALCSDSLHSWVWARRKKKRRRKRLDAQLLWLLKPRLKKPLRSSEKLSSRLNAMKLSVSVNRKRLSVRSEKMMRELAWNARFKPLRLLRLQRLSMLSSRLLSSLTLTLLSLQRKSTP